MGYVSFREGIPCKRPRVQHLNLLLQTRKKKSTNMLPSASIFHIGFLPRSQQAPKAETDKGEVLLNVAELAVREMGRIGWIPF